MNVVLKDSLAIIIMLFATIITGHEWFSECMNYNNIEKEYVTIRDINGMNIEYMYCERVYIQDSKYLFDYIGKKISIIIDVNGAPVRADFPISIMGFMFIMSLLYTISSIGLTYEQILIVKYKRKQKK